MNLEEVLNFRRSVRRYDKNKPIDPEKVKHCLELATLAPNSSNMKKEISGVIVRKCVRKNVLGTGSCIMVN